ncbi:MAG: peptidylprolyl isomerase [Bacilli bacterium]|jgi:peptidyl-prolyl cis-trans isomerase B (cyclophilin B)|nr:peptidylprolyl isomerase [Bacilli bacterium]
MIILKIANMGEIKIELDYKNAPISSANFVSLVNKGFYDGLTFHRIIKGFMIQGGCPLGNGTGGPGYSIKGEFRSNGVNNQLSHKRGVISMARAMNPNSAGSQFFICDKDDLFLDGQYAAFGHVIEGMDVVDKIASVKTGYQDRPLNKVVIEKALSVEEPEPEFEKIG